MAVKLACSCNYLFDGEKEKEAFRCLDQKSRAEFTNPGLALFCSDSALFFSSAGIPPSDRT